MFQSENSNNTWICGLYRIDEGFPYFVILTRDAVGDLKKIHDRMPLIMPSSFVTQWIDPTIDPTELLGSAITSLIYENVK